MLKTLHCAAKNNVPTQKLQFLWNAWILLHQILTACLTLSVHKCVVSCCIYLTYTKMMKMQTPGMNFSTVNVIKVTVFQLGCGVSMTWEPPNRFLCWWKGVWTIWQTIRTIERSLKQRSHMLQPVSAGKHAKFGPHVTVSTGICLSCISKVKVNAEWPVTKIGELLRFVGDKLIFQQDGALAHGTKVTEMAGWTLPRMHWQWLLTTN